MVGNALIRTIVRARLLMRTHSFISRRQRLFTMPVRAFVAVTGLIVAVFLSAGAMEGRTPESESEELRTTQSESQTGAAASAAPACPTPVPAAALPAQPDLARDIRTVLTGVKSPVQQDALAEAGKIAPGQMSDALRDVLVDVAAFVSSLDRSDTTGDPRLDSLAQYLVCALQPQVSQEELAADLDSPAAYDLVEPMRKARHISAAWLTMHIPAGDMGDELLRVLPRAMLSIGRGILSNYMAKGFLFEALTKQYAGYSDADLVAAIAQAAPTIEIAYIQQEVQDLRLQAEERAARIARAESAVRRSSRDDYFQRELADLSQEEVVARIRAIFEAGQYGVCGLGPPGWVFRYFPDTGAALLADIITRPTTPLGKMTDGLELLSELAASYKTGRNLGNWGGNLRFSEESRELLIATARHFMEGEFLSSLPTRDTTGVRSVILHVAIRFAVALDDPGVIEIVQALATDPDAVTALGILDERVDYVQGSARRHLSWRPYMGLSDC